MLDRAAISRAFAFCEEVTRTHYENFPVASLFLPKEKRPYVCAIYAFARTADDFADEGLLEAGERLRKIDDWEEKLHLCFEGRADHPVFVALAETVQQLEIPRQPLSDLLAAFRMDVTTTRFATFNDVLQYCSFSANPVGQLVLHVFRNANERTIPSANSICTALQLANFWQDIAVDWGKGRLYVPLEDCERFGYTEANFGNAIVDERFRHLMRFQVERTRAMFLQGKPLFHDAVRSLQFELRLVWLGGMTILRKIESANFDVYTRRPVVGFSDRTMIFLNALFVRGLWRD